MQGIMLIPDSKSTTPMMKSARPCFLLCSDWYSSLFFIRFCLVSADEPSSTCRLNHPRHERGTTAWDNEPGKLNDKLNSTLSTASCPLHPNYRLSEWQSVTFPFTFRAKYGGFLKEGYPKSFILIRFSIKNHPFWSTPILVDLQSPYITANSYKNSLPRDVGEETETFSLLIVAVQQCVFFG